MSIYQQEIRKHTDEDPALVEAWMRSEIGTHDHLDLEAFTSAIQEAAAAVDADRDLSIGLAASYGLTSTTRKEA